MLSGKLKCPKCGYIFEADTEANSDFCPLCDTEYTTSDALKLYCETKSIDIAPKKKTSLQIIWEWAIFIGVFTLFIFVLYIIISYIIGA